MRNSFTVTPSFLLKLMKHCSKLEKDIDVINTFERLAEANSPILTGNNVDELESEEVPEHLQDLQHALEGAVEVDEDDDE